MKTLQLLGDEVRARALAMSAEVPIVLGSEKLDSFKDFPKNTRFPIILKPILGGGGRGMRVVRKKEDLEEAFTRAQSEAEMCFGSKDIYYEEFVEFAKHVEVQIVSEVKVSISLTGTVRFRRDTKKLWNWLLQDFLRFFQKNFESQLVILSQTKF